MIRDNIEKHIYKTYSCKPDYPWFRYPGYAVYRHNDNKKWFAVVMDISNRKLGIQSDEIIDVMNIKCDPILIGTLLKEKGFYPAYHMNKGYWISVVLDKNVDIQQLKWLIDMSYELTSNKKKK